jgi:hypothetical protein
MKKDITSANNRVNYEKDLAVAKTLLRIYYKRNAGVTTGPVSK